MSVVLTSAEIFHMAMEIEKSGYAYYSAIADSTENTELQELFEFLAGEEQKHFRFFESLSKETQDFSIPEEDWENISEYIKATTESRFFVGEDKAIALAKQTKEIKEAIDIAIGFEKDTLLFFYEIMNVTPERSRSTATQIVNEEKRHILLLSEKKKQITKPLDTFSL